MAFYTTLNTLFPIYNYRFDDASSPVLNDGSGGGNLTEVSTGTAITYEDTGPGLEASDKATTLAGGVIHNASGHMVHGQSTQSCVGLTEGTMCLVMKTASAGIATSGLFTVQNTTDGRRVESRVRGGSNLDFYMQLYSTAGGTNTLDFYGSTNINDGEWHIIVVRQKADGVTGPELFVDSTIDEATILSTTGSYTIDTWFEDVFGVLTSSDNTYFGSLYGLSNKFSGSFGAFGITDVALTDGQIATLMEESGLADNFASKTIRRTGRRLFSPNV